MANEILTHISGTKAGNGDNEIVAAPGVNQRLVISFLMSQLEVDTATTMTWKAGSSAAYRYLATFQGGSFTKDFASDREWRLPANTALNLNLSGANSCGYSVEYRTEAV
jgi:hypothetical protein